MTHLRPHKFFFDDALVMQLRYLYIQPLTFLLSEIAINGIQFWDATRIFRRRTSEITRQLLFDTFNCGDILRPRVSWTEANARRGSLTVRSFIYATSDKWLSLNRPGRRDYPAFITPWFSFDLNIYIEDIFPILRRRTTSPHNFFKYCDTVRFFYDTSSGIFWYLYRRKYRICQSHSFNIRSLWFTDFFHFLFCSNYFPVSIFHCERSNTNHKASQYLYLARYCTNKISLPLFIKYLPLAPPAPRRLAWLSSISASRIIRMFHTYAYFDITRRRRFILEFSRVLRPYLRTHICILYWLFIFIEGKNFVHLGKHF